MKYFYLVTTLFLALAFFCNCDDDDDDPTYPNVDRESKIPDDISKVEPADDQHPPILHSIEFEAPVPVPYPLNTAGAEDSPFVTADGQNMYFFFTPDVRVKPEKQLLDSVTGVWVSQKEGGTWSKPERVWLQDPGKLALDGAVCVQGIEMWFASTREGFTGVNMFMASFDNGKWTNWQYAGDRLMKEIQIGEVHLHGDDLYFHSARTGTQGSYDIWKTTRNGDTWTDPVAVDSVNTAEMDGFPYVTPNGSELWFTRTYKGTPAVYRSKWINGKWSSPELMVSQFAGEPTLDHDGNLYFVHHFYKDNEMIEADIYVAKKK